VQNFAIEEILWGKFIYRRKVKGLPADKYWLMDTFLTLLKKEQPGQLRLPECVFLNVCMSVSLQMLYRYYQDTGPRMGVQILQKISHHFSNEDRKKIQIGRGATVCDPEVSPKGVLDPECISPGLSKVGCISTHKYLEHGPRARAILSQPYAKPEPKRLFSFVSVDFFSFS
jgi:hypothetical protein